MEEHRADTDAEGADTPHDDASDLRDRLGRLERMVAGMAAEAAVRGGESGEPAGTEAPETVETIETIETADAPEADTEVIPTIEREPEPETEPPVTHDGTATPRRTRRLQGRLGPGGHLRLLRRRTRRHAGRRGSAPPWMSIPGVTENNAEDPANSPPRPASSVSGAPDFGPGERAVPAPGDATRSGEAPEPSAGRTIGRQRLTRPRPDSDRRRIALPDIGEPERPGDHHPAVTHGLHRHPDTLRRADGPPAGGHRSARRPSRWPLRRLTGGQGRYTSSLVTSYDIDLVAGSGGGW